MQDQHQAIADIIYRFKKQQYLSEDETLWLHNWLNGSTARREWFEALPDSALLQEQIHEFLTGEEKAALWNKYQQRYPNQVVQPEKKKRPWTIMAAAASIVVIIVAAAFAFFNHSYNRRADELTTREQSTQDIEPGGDKAVLEMSDGSRFVLDAVADGVLQEKGSATIIKSKGLLKFQVGDKNDKQFAAISNTIRTPRGGQYQVVLPDGSKIWLNAGSSLTFPVVFSAKERRVLLSGEAYFEVASLPLTQAPSNSPGGGGKIPFKVIIPPQPGGKGGAEVEVLGTHFNVQAYNNDEVIKTTLLEGKVKVKPPTSKGEPVVLSPGQQAAMSNESSKISVKAVDAEESIAWKNNLFVFEQATVTEMMNTIQRWYDVEVDVEKASRQQFNATIPRDITIKKLFRLLEEASDGQVHFRLEGKKVVVQ